MKEKRSFRISRRQFLIVILMLTVLLALLMLGLNKIDRIDGKVRANVTIESGTSIDISLFTDDPEYVKPAIDLTTIDNITPSVINIPFWCDDIRYVSTLTIVDTVAPEAHVKDLKVDVDNEPDIMDYITGYTDLNPVTVSFVKEPDFTLGGVNEGSISFKDTSGNETVLPVKLTVIDDFEAPKILGVHPIESYENDTIKYREGITLEDNLDPNPTLEIDNSEVDISKPGTYYVKYIATDYTGNSREASAKVTILEKPETYVEPDIVYAEARKVLNEITTPDMTDAEKGFAIYFWCKENIHYVGVSDKSHWTKGAYDGFTTLRGDCYTYAVCAKAMLDCLGIDNYLIERCDPVTTSHYWNFLYMENDWYFMDCSSTNTPMNAYLLTGDELWALCATHGYRYNYDHTGLPNPSESSIQYKINYYTRTIDE